MSNKKSTTISLKKKPTKQKAKNPSEYKDGLSQATKAVENQDKVRESLEMDSATFSPDDDFDFTSIKTKPSKALISVSLLARRCLDKSQQQTENIDDLVNKLSQVTHARLDRENISEIDGLELLGNVRNLYLQHNIITEIEHLDLLKNLRFLTLSHNQIEQLINVKTLHKLAFLDLSCNKIETLDYDEVPGSLCILNLSENNCTQIPGYKRRILETCTKLSKLDGERLSVDERRSAGHDVTTDSAESEDDEVNASVAETPRPKPFDAEIIGVFGDLSSDIFLRCQSRIQQVLHDHNLRVGELDTIKNQSGVRDAESRNSNFTPRPDSPDTTDSSRPTTGENKQT